MDVPVACSRRERPVLDGTNIIQHNVLGEVCSALRFTVKGLKKSGQIPSTFIRSFKTCNSRHDGSQRKRTPEDQSEIITRRARLGSKASGRVLLAPTLLQSSSFWDSLIGF